MSRELWEYALIPELMLTDALGLTGDEKKRKKGKNAIQKIIDEIRGEEDEKSYRKKV